MHDMWLKKWGPGENNLIFFESEPSLVVRTVIFLREGSKKV